MITFAIVFVILFGCYATGVYIYKQHIKNIKRTFPLPPGPPGLPLIGPVIGINPSAPWLTFRDWAKTYGMSQ